MYDDGLIYPAPVPSGRAEIGELSLVALPAETVRALHSEAAARGITLGQLLTLALNSVLSGPRGPGLLTEEKSNG